MTFFTSISLITAFFGGMVALFAPCCITYLLPSYLANIFRSRTNVLLMTVLFGAGIATILVPTALGIRAFGALFERYHTATYIVGGVFMILLGAMELTGKKITLPMINLTIDLNAHKSPWAVYVLGIFSGITSSCCTPVLAGILTLSFLSPSFFWAGLAGLFYVFGMVVPLVVLALLLDRIQWTRVTGLKNKTITIAGHKTPITDAVAGFLFIAVGIMFSVLAITGNITMGETSSVEQMMGPTVFSWVSLLRSMPGADIIFAILVGVVILIFIKKRGKRL